MKQDEYLKIYIDELSQINPCLPEENLSLLRKVSLGDEQARARLIEGNLHLVPEVVIEYENSGAQVGDLIQEGNVALMDAVSALDGRDAGLEAFLTERIRAAIEEFIRLEGVETLASRKLEDEANRLINLTRDFEAEHERAASLAELSELMGLPEDEVENIMRISYSAMTMGDKSAGEEKAPQRNPLRDGWSE